MQPQIKHIQLRDTRPVKGSKSNPWVNGLEEIAADIHRLKIWHDELVSEGRQLGNLRLGVSTIYPTHAFLKFDNRLYVYHYPYMGRGFHAPCSLFTREDRPVYRYLVECMSAVVRESASLPESADDIWIRCKRGEFSDRTVERLEVAIRRVR